MTYSQTYWVFQGIFLNSLRYFAVCSVNLYKAINVCEIVLSAGFSDSTTSSSPSSSLSYLVIRWITPSASSRLSMSGWLISLVIRS